MYKKYPPGMTLTKEKQSLVIDNLGIAQKLSHKWYKGVGDYNDLLQHAYLILVDCAIKFDETNGVKFSTYAYRCIDLSLNNLVQENLRIVKFPINKHYKIHKYLTIKDKEEAERYKKENNLSDKDISFYKTYEKISIDAQVNDDYADVTNFYSKDEAGYNDYDNKDLIKNILLTLDEIIPDELSRNIFKDVIKVEFEKSEFKNIAKKYNVKLKDVYNTISVCQCVMKANKSKFL